MPYAEVTFDWADGEHKFKLDIGRLRELQDKTNSGPLELLRRLMAGTWRVDDYRETIRIGLIGGGMKPTDALKLVNRYVDERPATESVLVAQAILMPALFDPEGNSSGEANGRMSESKAGSHSSTSTVPAH